MISFPHGGPNDIFFSENGENLITPELQRIMNTLEIEKKNHHILTLLG